MRRPEPALELIEVAVERAGVRVLEDITLRITAGTITALVGQSGAGKTSLLRCMNGLDRPAAGTVRLQGDDVVRIKPQELRRRVGMIFQVPVLFEGTVLDNLEYGLDNPAPRRALEVLESVGLEDSLAERPARALSVGQGQRVCLARALMRGPEILLMDEPTSSLDKDAGAVIEALVTGLRDDGLTVVFVTHDLRQAQRVADSAALLGGGRLRYVGEPGSMDDLWEEHA
jgi:putative ABC transport system ATP-binding protein